MSVRDLLDLGGKVAVVTGGSRGIGLQMAEALRARISRAWASNACA